MKLRKPLKKRLINYLLDSLEIYKKNTENYALRIKRELNSEGYNSQWPDPDSTDEEELLAWINIHSVAECYTWYHAWKHWGHFFEAPIYNAVQIKVAEFLDTEIMLNIDKVPPRHISLYIDQLKTSGVNIPKKTWRSLMRKKYSERNEWMRLHIPDMPPEKVNEIYREIRDGYFWRYVSRDNKALLQEKLKEIITKDDIVYYFKK